MRRRRRVEFGRRQDVVGLKALEGPPFAVLVGGVAQDGQAVMGEPHPAEFAFLTGIAVRKRLTTVQHAVIVDDDDLTFGQGQLALVLWVGEIVLLQAVEGVDRPVRDIGGRVVTEAQHDGAVIELLENGAVDRDLVVAAIGDAAFGREDAQVLRIFLRKVIVDALNVDEDIGAACRCALPALQNQHFRRQELDVVPAAVN